MPHPGCPSRFQVDETLIDLLKTQPALAIALLTANVFVSTALIRFLFGNVLDFGRFYDVRR